MYRDTLPLHQIMLFEPFRKMWNVWHVSRGTARACQSCPVREK